MLVDLERNDLGMYCTPGSVRVSGLLTPIEIGPTTYLATDVQGRVESDVSLATLLLTSFPRGVVSGAPKSTALRLIGAIEGEPRGFYAGAMGWYRGFEDELISNTIVTCAYEDESELVLQCGGGITNESTASQEFYELELKLRYLI
jgi:anthranilate/para-aminobenzoate synthase component I